MYKELSMRQVIKGKCKDLKEKNLDGSGLETFFKVNILDKLGILYTQQFEATDIKRYYDFRIKNTKILIEVHGTYYHSDPRKYKTPKYAIQKRNVKNDKIKMDWAYKHGFILLIFWEKEIKENTPEVIKLLKNKLLL